MTTIFVTTAKRFDIRLDNLTFGLWLVCIFSLFIPIQFYVPLFTLFIFSVAMLAILRAHFALVRPPIVSLLLVGFTYIMWASVSFILNRDFSVHEQYIKLVLNSSFLLASVVFFEMHRHRLSSMFSSLKRLLTLLIVLSAAQVALNVVLLNAWLWPFSGQVSNSSAAYLIVTPGVFFGGAEKNIWATKIALVVCLYIGILWVKRNTSWTSWIVIGLGLFSVLYTFSRTAQLTTFVGLALFIFLIVLSSRQRLARYALLGAILLLIPFILQWLAGLLRFDWSLFDLSQGTQDDGFRGRLFLWTSFLNNLSNFNFLWGNGIQYGRYYFSEVSSEIAFLGNDNFHNAFLNHLVDSGVVGLVLYALLFVIIFARPKALSTRLLLLLPLLACISLQYVGYDNDIMAYLAAAWLILQVPAVSEETRNRLDNPKRRQSPIIGT
ncbi:O-antigen ligase family protein [Meiothermus cerbereus]|jgi:O-antigen ligase|uniref:O-antigen ligase family protein n=1 Tax=Meiothermus cerbereus TaxID=65552 RepID=UPI0031769A48